MSIRRKAMMVLGIFVIGVAGVAVVRFSAPLTPEELGRKFITANPLDLSQV
ncbi:MAG: hypothetical protein HYZ07_00225, partial [Candidatus Harrisonbacteria bacterium]|nr:hypothetical protein [Candidatus Harrisonbacteria bacterium]